MAHKNLVRDYKLLIHSHGSCVTSLQGVLKQIKSDSLVPLCRKEELECLINRLIDRLLDSAFKEVA